MTLLYLDSSAAFKLIHSEPESAALAAHLSGDVTLISSELIETELRRAAQRNGRVTHEVVSDLIAGMNLVPLERPVFVAAGLLPGDGLRSLDAVHLVASMRVAADAVVTYDARMTASARELGLTVVAPV